MTDTLSPGCRSARDADRSVVVRILVAPILTMISPVVIPTLSAGPPGVTPVTNTPTGLLEVSTTVVARMPRSARWELTTRPLAMIWVAMSLTVLAGIANPIPFAAPRFGSAAVSVGIPTTRPDRSTRAPPLLPGLIAALVWTVSGRVMPPRLGDSSIQRANDALGDAALEAEWIADSKDEHSDLERARVRERRGLNWAGDPDDREIARGERSNERGRLGLALRCGHLDRRCSRHHMVVGDHIALAIEDNSGTEAGVRLDLYDKLAYPFHHGDEDVLKICGARTDRRAHGPACSRRRRRRKRGRRLLSAGAQKNRRQCAADAQTRSLRSNSRCGCTMSMGWNRALGHRPDRAMVHASIVVNEAAPATEPLVTA